MSFYRVALAALPLLIPVAVWLLTRMNSSPSASSAAPVLMQEDAHHSSSSSSSDVPRKPRHVVQAFTSGGAISSSAHKTWVKDVIQGEHECILFAYVEQLYLVATAHKQDKKEHSEEQQRSDVIYWGDFLDAGTGTHSLGWVAALNTSRIVAVTGDRGQQKEMRDRFRPFLRETDSIEFGNWEDDDFLQGQMFDVVLADYLIGAVDGFAPYFQELVLPRLKKHLRPGGLLFIVGTEPIYENYKGPGQQLIADVCRARDACILLGGDRRRIYREFPLDWVMHQISLDSEWEVIGVGNFDINYTERTLLRQIGVGERKLAYVDNEELKRGLQSYLNELKSKVYETKWSGVKLGVDYVVGIKLKEKNKN